ncbi:jg22042 [Pararge aegeria aegeria]|uniref:Lipase n=1 Tax=Pararge aegeria aegeria TaxID=348720 RepID=A0A8S4RK70_9NEOP|nr:jg22042 [Pararge aegeria aegeria]
MLGIVTIVTVLVCVQGLTSDVEWTDTQNSARYNAELRIAIDGYQSESHTVITSDGYILEMNRIPNPRFQIGPIRPRNKPVVFLMHGLQSAFTSFIAAGPRISLAYILADAGYDVWMGNARGVVNSRRHVWLNPDHEEDRLKFFDFTFEDIATKDLPTMIDYVLRTTQQRQLNYIGHSQGGTSFLVLNSLMPAYNKKFLSVHLLAGVGYQNYFPNNALSIAATSTDLIYAIAVNAGSVELLGPNNDVIIDVEVAGELKLCNSELEQSSPLLCKIKSAYSIMRGIFAPLESLAGASIKQYAHFGQNIRDKAFRRWNYNPLKNLWLYGSVTPPDYDISLVTADITMHYTVGDTLLHENDVLNMVKALPNARARRVARDSFSHFDFVISADSRDLVTNYIVKRMNETNKPISDSNDII